MRYRTPKETVSREAASDVWRKTLSQIPSVFGRLVYLTNLRDPNSNRYEHHGLAMMFGEAESNAALSQSHAAAFDEWVNFNVEQQKADLDLYLSGLEVEKRHIVESWLKLKPYRNMIPSSASSPARDLYLADLGALLELLKNEYGVAVPDPDA